MRVKAFGVREDEDEDEDEDDEEGVMREYCSNRVLVDDERGNEDEDKVELGSCLKTLVALSSSSSSDTTSTASNLRFTPVKYTTKLI